MIPTWLILAWVSLRKKVLNFNKLVDAMKVLIKDKADNRYTLIVSDDGVSFPEDLDFRETETLGMQLVNILTEQLHGTIEIDRSGGTSFKIVF